MKISGVNSKEEFPVDGVLRAAVPVWTLSLCSTQEELGTYKARAAKSSFFGALGMTSNFSRAQPALWPSLA